MPSPNDLNTRPHPPPPPPVLSDAPNIPQGGKKAVPRDAQAHARASAFGHQMLQCPDRRRILGHGPGQQDYGTHNNYPNSIGPPSGGAQYPTHPHQGGGGFNPGGSNPAYGGYGPPNYPMGGGPPPHPNPGPLGPSALVGGGFKPTSALAKHWRKFVMNQKVQVNVLGNGWLVGFVVAVMEGLSMVLLADEVQCILLIISTFQLTKSQVRVRYEENRQHREDVFDNDPDYIRPYSDTKY